MKEKPILFSGPMVRAILDGRKTQTRRPIKPQPFVATPSMFDLSKCPLGQPGDRLWVRETWGLMAHHDPTDWHRGSIDGASEDAITPMFGVEHRANWKIENENAFWRPSIHMPRWASRITLEIARVWVERVQDITEDGAIREGMVRVDRCSPFQMFRDTWQSIYGTWDANPFVWAVEFRGGEMTPIPKALLAKFARYPEPPKPTPARKRRAKARPRVASWAVEVLVYWPSGQDITAAALVERTGQPEHLCAKQLTRAATEGIIRLANLPGGRATTIWERTRAKAARSTHPAASRIAEMATGHQFAARDLGMPNATRSKGIRIAHEMGLIRPVGLEQPKRATYQKP